MTMDLCRHYKLSKIIRYVKHYTTTGKWTGADYEVFDKYISFIKSALCYVMEPIVCCLVKTYIQADTD